jgi:CheY-like chemotaxis protein
MSRILIVEDNDENYLLIEEILYDYKVELVRASHGAEFFSTIEKTKNFQLVLMDLMLPDIDGIELTKYIYENNLRIPVVFISAYTERCEEIYELGVEYFINKPIITQLFLSIVSKYVPLDLK